jgi:hypothetical protein
MHQGRAAVARPHHREERDMKTFKAVICKTGWTDDAKILAHIEAPEIVDFKATYENINTFIGGDLEFVPIGPGIFAYCNENGIAQGLAPNRCGLVGNFIVLGDDGEGGERSLTETEAEQVLAFCYTYRFEMHPHYCGVKDGFTFESFETPGQFEARIEEQRQALLDRWQKGIAGG